jgi:hypothetical protein
MFYKPQTATLIEIIKKWWADGRPKHLRLGQYFCNLFIEEPWPELYYEGDDDTAAAKIEEWLIRHHYTEEFPPVIKRVDLPH